MSVLVYCKQPTGTEAQRSYEIERATINRATTEYIRKRFCLHHASYLILEVCGIRRRGGGWQGRDRRDDIGTHPAPPSTRANRCRGRNPLLSFAAPSRCARGMHARAGQSMAQKISDVVNRRRVTFSAGWPRLFALAAATAFAIPHEEEMRPGVALVRDAPP